MKIKQNLFSIATLTATFCMALLLLIIALVAPIPYLWSLLILIPSALLAVYERPIKAYFSARSLKFDENILISTALILLFASGHAIEGSIAALISRLIFVTDKVLINKSKKLRNATLPTVSETAWIQLSDGTYKEISAEEVEIGTVVLARPYEDEFVPADGIVVQGEGKMSALALNGSDEDFSVSPGSVVYSGMKSLENPIHIKVTSNPSNSAAAKIRKALSEDKSGNIILHLTRKICRIAAPTVFVLSLISALLLIFVFKINVLTSLYIAGAMLLCIAPTLSLSTLTRGVYKIQSDALVDGIIFKNRDALEGIASADAVVFDGAENIFDFNPTLEEIIDINGIGKENIMLFFAALLQDSTLVWAKAVRNGISGVKLPSLDRVIEKKGMGVAAELDGKKFLCGTRELFDYVGIDVSSVDAELYLSIGKKLYGALKIKADPISLAQSMIEKISDDFTDEIFIMIDNADDISKYQLDRLDNCVVKLFKSSEEKSDFLAELSEKHRHIVLFSDNDEIDITEKPITQIVSGFDKGIVSENADVVACKDSSDRLLGVLDYSRKTALLRSIEVATLDLSVLLLGFTLFGYLPASVALLISALLPIAALVGFSGMIKRR